MNNTNKIIEHKNKDGESLLEEQLGENVPELDDTEIIESQVKNDPLDKDENVSNIAGDFYLVDKEGKSPEIVWDRNKTNKTETETIAIK